MIDLTCTLAGDCPAEQHDPLCLTQDEPAVKPALTPEQLGERLFGVEVRTDPAVEPGTAEVRDSITGQTLGEVRVTSSTGGQKGTKPERYDLVPHEPLKLLALLYGRGAEKYAPRNWERGYPWSLSYAAAMRHLTAFWRGEDIDPEMGLPHVICAAFHLFALAEFLTTQPSFDDRPGSTDNEEKS